MGLNSRDEVQGERFATGILANNATFFDALNVLKWSLQIGACVSESSKRRLATWQCQQLRGEKHNLVTAGAFRCIHRQISVAHQRLSGFRVFRRTASADAGRDLDRILVNLKRGCQCLDYPD